MNEKNLALFLVVVLFIVVGWYIPALVVFGALVGSLVQVETA